MNISICKWYKNAASPVLFLIDDLANVWIDVNGNGKIDLEEDWGYAKNGKNSSIRFLNEKILKNFTYVKVTFFMPVGIRAGVIENPKIKSISRMINCDEGIKKFFRSINEDERYEIAYHGTTHGKVGKTRYEFKQEWELFNNIDEAITTINKGKEIYKEVFGYYPIGGKYCGYTINEYSDESIDKTGFKWWCRFHNRGLIDNKNYTIGGNDFNPLSNFDLKTFGINKVVDIPTTVNGYLVAGLLNPNKGSLKGIMKIILKNYLIEKRLNQINFLLKNNLVISIYEHISPARDDGNRQTPNIFDDQDSLKYIFNYLKDKNVWYCTGTELAQYYITRANIKIKYISDSKFIIENAKMMKEQEISIMADDKYGILYTPSGEKKIKQNGCYTFCISEGEYSIQ